MAGRLLAIATVISVTTLLSPQRVPAVPDPVEAVPSAASELAARLRPRFFMLPDFLCCGQRLVFRHPSRHAICLMCQTPYEIDVQIKRVKPNAKPSRSK